MLRSSSSIPWLTRRKGSRILQRSLWSHSPRTVTHEVMKSGPSIARITSNAEIIPGIASQRVTAVGPVLRMQQPGLDQPLQNLGQRLLGNAVGVRYILGAAGARARACSARCFMAINP